MTIVRTFPKNRSLYLYVPLGATQPLGAAQFYTSPGKAPSAKKPLRNLKKPEFTKEVTT